MSSVRAAREGVLPLTRIPVARLAPDVVVVGDPERARAVGERLDGAVELASNREYLSIGGTYRGHPVTVVSHGVGGPGAGVAFEELCRGGARRIIRAGTAGGLQPEVGDGSVVVVTAAVREDGLTDLLVPPGFPAVADARLTIALEDAARAAGSTRSGCTAVSCTPTPPSTRATSSARGSSSGSVPAASPSRWRRRRCSSSRACTGVAPLRCSRSTATPSPRRTPRWRATTPSATSCVTRWRRP